MLVFFPSRLISPLLVCLRTLLKRKNEKSLRKTWKGLYIVGGYSTIEIPLKLINKFLESEIKREKERRKNGKILYKILA